jgi:Uncharacterized protein conserved in bacteria (DUF2252)
MECVPGSNKVRPPLVEIAIGSKSSMNLSVSLNMERATDITKSSISRRTGPFAHIMSPAARVATGKALRDKIPRDQQGRWNESKGRRDTIELLRESDIGRMKKLIPIRYGRMLPSPFTFYRGAAGVMAADLARTPTTGLRVQACGDCHLVNFGGFATPERSIIFDINDFDETAPGPWEWDVKRLVASIVLAARSNGLSDHRGRDCAVNCARRYREHMRELAKMDPLAICTRKPEPQTLSNLCRRPCRGASRNGSKRQRAEVVRNLIFPSLQVPSPGRSALRTNHH